jgi:hypothetical protein
LNIANSNSLLLIVGPLHRSLPMALSSQLLLKDGCILDHLAVVDASTLELGKFDSDSLITAIKGIKAGELTLKVKSDTFCDEVRSTLNDYNSTKALHLPTYARKVDAAKAIASSHDKRYAFL